MADTGLPYHICSTAIVCGGVGCSCSDCRRICRQKNKKQKRLVPFGKHLVFIFMTSDGWQEQPTTMMMKIQIRRHIHHTHRHTKQTHIPDDKVWLEMSLFSQKGFNFNKFRKSVSVRVTPHSVCVCDPRVIQIHYSFSSSKWWEEGDWRRQ